MLLQDDETGPLPTAMADKHKAAAPEAPKELLVHASPAVQVRTHGPALVPWQEAGSYWRSLQMHSHATPCSPNHVSLDSNNLHAPSILLVGRVQQAEITAAAHR